MMFTNSMAGINSNATTKQNTSGALLHICYCTQGEMFHPDVKWQVCCTGNMLFCIHWCLPLLFHNEIPSTSSTFCWHAGAGRFFSSSSEGAVCTHWKCFVLSPDGTFKKGISENISAWMYYVPAMMQNNSFSNTDRLTFITLRGTCQKPNHLWLKKKSINLSAVHRWLSKPYIAVSLFTVVEYNAVDGPQMLQDSRTSVLLCQELQQGQNQMKCDLLRKALPWEWSLFPNHQTSSLRVATEPPRMSPWWIWRVNRLDSWDLKGTDWCIIGLRPVCVQ